MNLLLLIFIVLYWYNIKYHTVKTDSTYTITVGVIILLLGGLRNEAIYGDTLSYCIRFREMLNYSVTDIPLIFRKDPFFYIASYYLSLLVDGEYTYWLMIISIIYMIPMIMIVKKYSLNPMYSWVAFMFIGLYIFIMAGLRQTVAMGLTLTAFMLLLQKKDILFFLLVGFAYLFHGSALIFLIIYPIIRFKIKFNAVAIIFYLILAGVLAIMGDSIMSNMIDMLSEQDERFVAYGKNMKGSTIGYFLQQLIIVVPSLIILRNKLHERYYAIFAHLSMIGLAIVILCPIIAEMFRLSMYFSWGAIILFAAAMMHTRERYIPLGYMMVFFVYLIFISQTATNEYLIFFQDNTAYIHRTYEWLDDVF